MKRYSGIYEKTMLKSDFSVMTEKTQIVKQNEFCKKTTEMWFFCWKEDTYNSQDTQFMHIILNFLIDRMMRGGVQFKCNIYRQTYRKARTQNYRVFNS